jgi:hypothetical protein
MNPVNYRNPSNMNPVNNRNLDNGFWFLTVGFEHLVCQL